MCRTIKETDVLLLKCWFVVFQDKQVKQGGDLCLQVMLKDCIQAFTAQRSVRRVCCTVTLETVNEGKQNHWPVLRDPPLSFVLYPSNSSHGRLTPRVFTGGGASAAH